VHPVHESNPTQWLLNNWPNVRIAAKKTLMERQRFPHFVQEYIEEKWIKVSDASGGIWEEPVYHQQQKSRRDFSRKAALSLPEQEKYNKMFDKTSMDFEHPRTGQAMTFSEMRKLYN
jgi:hypothetical protein